MHPSIRCETASPASSAGLAITYRPVMALRPHPSNPRIHSKKQVRQIARSIEQFGFLIPILIDANQRIICGHGRAQAAELIAMTEVPTLMVENLSEAQIKAFLIADNKLTEKAEWDMTLLAQNLQELSSLDLDFSLELTGFDMGEIDFIISESQAAGEGKPDPADEISDGSGLSAVCQTGDLWILDRHRILCGDALQEASFAVLMDGNRADMVFIDPPYNVKVDGHVCGTGTIRHREFAMASGEMTSQEFNAFLTQTFRRLAENTTDGSIHYVCMDFRHITELMTAGNQVFTELKNMCVWVKDNAGLGSFYRGQHELVFVFKNGTAPHTNNFELGQHGRYRTNVWHYPGVNSFSRKSGEEGNLLALHPTVKPVALVADAIMDCSNRGDIILDSFLGSGTTLLAAERVGRRCFGMELDPLYVDTAIRRWQKHTGNIAVHAVAGVPFGETATVKEF